MVGRKSAKVGRSYARTGDRGAACLQHSGNGPSSGEAQYRDRIWPLGHLLGHGCVRARLDVLRLYPRRWSNAQRHGQCLLPTHSLAFSNARRRCCWTSSASGRTNPTTGTADYQISGRCLPVPAESLKQASCVVAAFQPFLPLARQEKAVLQPLLCGSSLPMQDCSPFSEICPSEGHKVEEVEGPLF